MKLSIIIYGLVISLLVALVLDLFVRRGGYLQGVEMSITDEYYKYRKPTRKEEPRIVILGIEEEDITRSDIGYPLFDKQLADALKKLVSLKPKAIGVDLYRDLPVPITSNFTPSIAEYFTKEKTILDEVLVQNKNIICITKLGDKDHPTIKPPPAIKDSVDFGGQVSCNDISVDTVDNLIRRGMLFQDDMDGNTFYSFTLQLAVQLLGQDFISQPDENDPALLQLGKARLRPFEGNEGPYSNHPGGGFTYLLDNLGPKEFTTFTFSQFIDGEITENDIKDKLVLLGATAESLHDYSATPYNMKEPGIEIHAQMLDQILRMVELGDEPIKTYSTTTESILIFVFALLGVALAISGRSVLLLVLSSLVLVFGLIGVSVLLFKNYNTWIPVLPMLLSLLGSAMVALFYLFFTEGKEKKVMRGMFGPMVGPSVLKFMEENPESVGLTGARKTATILFSDVAGFTTISEKLSASDLSAVLNVYLTPMTNIIMNYNGMIDKYEGDAIMANFGVPVWEKEDPESHAWKCCHSAIEQMEKLEELNKGVLKTDYDLTLGVRFGINSGEVSAGNMGSDQRFQYTVMGDTVNQAARFEPGCKIFGVSIMIGGTTYDFAKEKIEARFLGLLRAKGKESSVRVYELLAKKGELPDDKMKLVAKFEEAWETYSHKDFTKAKSMFDGCLAIDPNDEPSKIFANQCVEFTKSPPPEKWSGEWIQLTK